MFCKKEVRSLTQRDIMDIQYILVDTSSSADWWDRIPAIASGLIALCALGVSLYQVYLSRLHNRLSEMPHLALHVEQSLGQYKIQLRNDGIGPAIITSASIMNRGKISRGCWSAADWECYSSCARMHSFRKRILQAGICIASRQRNRNCQNSTQPDHHGL